MLVALVVVGQVAALCKPARIQSGELNNILHFRFKIFKNSNRDYLKFEAPPCLHPFPATAGPVPPSLVLAALGCFLVPIGNNSKK